MSKVPQIHILQLIVLFIVFHRFHCGYFSLEFIKWSHSLWSMKIHKYSKWFSFFHFWFYLESTLTFLDCDVKSSSPPSPPSFHFHSKSFNSLMKSTLTSFQTPNCCFHCHLFIYSLQRTKMRSDVTLARWRSNWPFTFWGVWDWSLSMWRQGRCTALCSLK